MKNLKSLLEKIQEKGNLLLDHLKKGEQLNAKLKLKRNSLAWPVQSIWRISQLYGVNPALYKHLGLAAHNGIDFGVPVGTPIYACDYGVVSRVKVDLEGYGLHMKIKHDWGVATYAHLSRFIIKPNCYVRRGQLIGYSGNTGYSTGPHLHFDMQIDGVRVPGYYDRVNPWPYMEVDDYYKERRSSVFAPHFSILE